MVEARDVALDELAKLKHGGDPEATHADADRVLCALLISLGYGDVVEAWNSVPKWYA